MKSVRLGPDLERKLEEAARRLGVSESQIIREAVAARCNEILEETLARRLQDYVGALRLGGGIARDTGQGFTALLEAREREKKRR